MRDPFDNTFNKEFAYFAYTFNGLKVLNLAITFETSQSTVYKAIKEYRQTLSQPITFL